MNAHRKLGLATLAGLLAAAGAWHVTSGMVQTRTTEMMSDARGRVRRAAQPSSATSASRRVAMERRARPREIDWGEPRDPGWAAPMEQALASLAAERLGHLLPEGRFREVTCRTTSCSFEIACHADTVDMCQQVASVLVLVDGMTLRLRQQAVDSDGWVPVLVDVSLPPGDAVQVRAAIAAELAARPEVTERVASSLEDSWMVDNLRRAIDAAFQRLLLEAWERGGRRDPACTGEVLMLAARVEARADEMTVTLDADDACARAYFAGHATVHDHEVGGPFPVTQLVVPVPVPQELSARLADRPDAP